MNCVSLILQEYSRSRRLRYIPIIHVTRTLTTRPPAPRNPGVYNNNRGTPADRPQHGPPGVRPGGQPKKVHRGKGVYQHAVLQRGLNPDVK